MRVRGASGSHRITPAARAPLATVYIHELECDVVDSIPEQLERYRPGTSSVIVILRPVEDVATFEAAPSGTWGDFVIQTDEARTLEAIECRKEEG